MAIVACAQCGAKNRVDERADVMRPVCGRCGADLPAAATADGTVVHVTDASFAHDVLGVAGKPVLLDCWAPWCGPCRAIAPMLDQMAAASGGRWIIAKLNVDENPQTAARFGIQSIPTLLIFKNGKLLDQLNGALPRAIIEARLTAHA